MIRLRPYVMLSILATASLASLVTQRSVAAEVSQEYEIKAVYLFNFAKFVDWPPSAFGSATAPLVIGVLGMDPFGPLLEKAIAGERINGRPIKVERYARVQDAAACHILFVAKSESARVPEILLALAGRSVLSVGETDGFATAGGIIRLVNEDDRIHFRINLDAAKTAKLTISSKLLRPSDVIRKGD